METVSYGSTSNRSCQAARGGRSAPLTAAALATKIEAARLNRNHVLILACCFLNHFCLGHMNDAIGLAFSHFDPSWHADDPNRAAILPVSLMSGIVLSNLFTGSLSDQYGRRFVSRMAFVCGFVAQVCCVLAPSLMALSAARVLAGFAFGAAMITVPTLLSEVVPASDRHLLVAYPFGWPLGGLLFSICLSRFTWQVATAAAIPCSLALMIIAWHPSGLVESPQFLLAKGRREEAMFELSRVTGEIAAMVPDSEVEDSVHRDAGSSMPTCNVTEEVWKIRFVLGRTVVCILCQGLASQGFKVWLPTIANLRGAHLQTMQFAWMMLVDVLGQFAQPFILMYCLTEPKGKGASSATADIRLLNLARVFSLSAMLSVAGVMAADRPAVYMLLGGVHLVAQGSMYNFLVPYATLCFPVVIRARCIGLVCLAGCIGNAAGPLFGSFFLSHSAKMDVGAGCTLWTTAAIYFAGLVSMMGIPPQNTGSATSLSISSKQ